MADVDEFLASVLPPLTAADTALHNGDAGQRIALGSRNEPVTLFGALQIKTGWAEIAPVFEWVASRFSNCESFEYEVIAAGASGDLAYIVGKDRRLAAVQVRLVGRYCSSTERRAGAVGYRRDDSLGVALRSSAAESDRGWAASHGASSAPR